MVGRKEFSNQWFPADMKMSGAGLDDSISYDALWKYKRIHISVLMQGRFMFLSIFFTNRKALETFSSKINLQYVYNMNA